MGCANANVCAHGVRTCSPCLRYVWAVCLILYATQYRTSEQTPGDLRTKICEYDFKLWYIFTTDVAHGLQWWKWSDPFSVQIAAGNLRAKPCHTKTLLPHKSTLTWRPSTSPTPIPTLIPTLIAFVHFSPAPLDYTSTSLQAAAMSHKTCILSTTPRTPQGAHLVHQAVLNTKAELVYGKSATRTISTTTNKKKTTKQHAHKHLQYPIAQHPPSSYLTQFALSSRVSIAYSRLKSTRLQIERMKIMWNFTDGARKSECIKNCEAFGIPLCGQDKQSWHSIELVCDLAIWFQ